MHSILYHCEENEPFQRCFQKSVCYFDSGLTEMKISMLAPCTMKSMRISALSRFHFLGKLMVLVCVETLQTAQWNAHGM